MGEGGDTKRNHDSIPENKLLGLILFWLSCTDNINAGASGTSGSSVVDLVTPQSSTVECVPLWVMCFPLCSSQE